LPPPTAAAGEHPSGSQISSKKSKRFRKISLAIALGWHDFALMETNVVPVILPPEIRRTLAENFALHYYGIWVSPIWFVAKPRLITVNASQRRWTFGCDGSNSGLVVNND